MPPISRRRLIASGSASLAASAFALGTRAAEFASAPRRVAVVGMGIFGGWTAHWLLERGCQVTQFDQWGAGNGLSSSGGETRILRLTYGHRKSYSWLAAEARISWKAFEMRFGARLLEDRARLTLVGEDEDEAQASIDALERLGAPFERLEPAQMAERYPALALDDVRWGLLEREAGVLRARAACLALADANAKLGATQRRERIAAIEPGAAGVTVRGEGGRRETFDIVVLACGAWSGKLRAELTALVRPTRQPALFFWPGAQHAQSLVDADFPILSDPGARVYLVPSNEHRGFKFATHRRGEIVDPDTLERLARPAEVELARDYLRRRFPAIRHWRLVESRVCQYEDTPDEEFIVDWLDGRSERRVLAVTGGSGHGFQHGPAVGQVAARMITEDLAPREQWRLARFETTSRETAPRPARSAADSRG